MTDLAQTIAAKAVEQSNNPTVMDLVRKQSPQIAMQLGGALNSDAFVRAALSEIRKSDKLQQATPESLLGAIMQGAQLKLEIGSALGHFYLTPRLVSFKNPETNGWDKRWECVPIIGYQGLIELAYRSGQISKIETIVVRDGDHFKHWADSRGGSQYEWRPADYDEERPWTGIIASASRTAGGDPIWVYMPKEKVLKRRPEKWARTPWDGHEEEMARKTAVREFAPYLPKSTEFAQAVQISREVEENGARVNSIAGVADLVVVPDAEGDADA